MTRDEIIVSLAVNAWINGGRVVWPKADLTDAILTEASLTGANLTEADLYGADLIGACITLGNRTLTLTEETAR